MQDLVFGWNNLIEDCREKGKRSGGLPKKFCSPFVILLKAGILRQTATKQKENTMIQEISRWNEEGGQIRP